MTHKDMLDVFTPGQSIYIIYNDDTESEGLTLVGWRDNGIVAESESLIFFVPFANVFSIGVLKETSHA